MRTGKSRSTLTPASASLWKVAAPAPGRFAILTVTAGRIRYWMSAPSSAAWAAASSSAMKATTPLLPCVVAHNRRLTPLLAIASHRRASSPGWLSSCTVNALIWDPSPARRPAPLPTLNLPGRRADNRLAVPGWRPPRGYPGLDGSSQRDGAVWPGQSPARAYCKPGLRQHCRRSPQFAPACRAIARSISRTVFPAVGLAGVGGWEQVGEGDAEACKALRAGPAGHCVLPL